MSKTFRFADLPGKGSIVWYDEPAPPPKPPCATGIKFRDGSGPDKYRGQIFDASKADYGGNGTVLLNTGHEFVHYPSEAFEPVMRHTFADSGCQRSWCRNCNAVGQFNWLTGKYE